MQMINVTEFKTLQYARSVRCLQIAMTGIRCYRWWRWWGHLRGHMQHNMKHDHNISAAFGEYTSLDIPINSQCHSFSPELNTACSSQLTYLMWSWTHDVQIFHALTVDCWWLSCNEYRNKRVVIVQQKNSPWLACPVLVQRLLDVPWVEWLEPVLPTPTIPSTVPWAGPQALLPVGEGEVQTPCQCPSLVNKN